MTAQTSFIRIDHVSKVFGGGNGVHDVSIDIPRGAFVVLLGPSGCGKSTTLRLIAGLETPDSGAIYIDGRDVTAEPPAKRGLSMVFQSYALFPHLSVAENIVFGLKVRKCGKDDILRRLAESLDLTGLAGLENRKPSALSGGQRQRVALARAIVAGHPLCLMDEPLSNLDAKLRHSVRKDIRDLQQRLGITVVYVTHDQTEAMGMADTVILMNNGRVEQAGSPTDLYCTPATAFAAGFVGSPPMELLPATLLPPEMQPRDIAPEDLLLGVRPEDFQLIPETGRGLSAKVVSTEFLGPETFVYLAIAGTGEVTARLPGRVHCSPGMFVSLSWARVAAHWFARESGQRLMLSGATPPARSIDSDSATSVIDRSLERTPSDA
ncbi:ABC transporter ATP-binding protein [Thalassospira sp.]|uniref:ABC transporter ATP-binding protein n=1 Tax=Thalassospira sp. TaxID=1912094 RepID=UPI002733066C|nr:ABC transporter ATP-binding protein [Thalassospira sp.]MDP2698677.1 ABC transporter ATP-binding protein [Thalassospira sp.]